MRTFAHQQKPPQQMKSVNSATQGRAFLGQNHAVQSILHLQSPIGNQAVQRVLQANPEQKLQADSLTVTSTRLAYDFTKIRLDPKARTKIQPKLTVSTTEDIYEREADRVAEQVVRMPESKLRRACACGGECHKCRKRQSSQGYEQLVTTHVNTSDAREAELPPIVHEVLHTPGQPLDAETRVFMESRFGHDFSQVRVHADAKAADSAQAVSALAYTIGRDIVFGAGQYVPRVSTGKRLIAHELTHVEQQGAAGTSAAKAQNNAAKRMMQRYSHQDCKEEDLTNHIWP